MANIKNNHTGPLNIGGVNIPAGVTASVEKWDSVKHGNGVRVWLASKLIEVVGGESKPAAAAPVAPLPGLPGLPGLPAATQDTAEDLEKDKLIEQLRGYGIEKTRKTKLENLQAALAEAQKGA